MDDLGFLIVDSLRVIQNGCRPGQNITIGSEMNY